MIEMCVCVHVCVCVCVKDSDQVGETGEREIE